MNLRELWGPAYLSYQSVRETWSQRKLTPAQKNLIRVRKLYDS